MSISRKHVKIAVYFLILFLLSLVVFKGISSRTATDFIQIIMLSFIVSVAILIPLLKGVGGGRKYLISQTPKAVFYKIPLGTLVPTILISVIIEGLFLLEEFVVKPSYLNDSYPGSHGISGSVAWPFLSLFYIAGVFITCLIISIFMYFLQKAKYKI